MFDFLDTASKAIGPISQILNAVKGNPRTGSQLQKYSKEYGMNPLDRPQTQAETQSNALYQALLDPTNPILQHLSEQDRKQGIDNFQNQIREMQLADAREGQMGHRSTFFNPERADETVSYLTSRAMPQLTASVLTNAQNTIYQAAGGIQRPYEIQQKRQDNQFKSAAQDIMTRTQSGQSMPGTIGNAQVGINSLQQLLKALNIGQSQQQPLVNNGLKGNILYG